MKYSVELVGPKEAAKYLANNTGNRRLRSSWVEALADAMTRGEWDTTHQGIAFDEAGALLDGQHRLHAIIKSGLSITMPVCRGLSSAVFRSVDAGRTRAWDDRIEFLDDREANQCAVRAARAYLRAALREWHPTAQQISAELELRRQGYLLAAEHMKRRIGGVINSMVAAGVVSYAARDAVRAADFVSRLCTPHGHSGGDPVSVLRQAVVEGRVRKDVEPYWKTVAATRAHSEGRALVRLYAAAEDWQGNHCPYGAPPQRRSDRKAK